MPKQKKNKTRATPYDRPTALCCRCGRYTHVCTECFANTHIKSDADLDEKTQYQCPDPRCDRWKPDWQKASDRDVHMAKVGLEEAKLEFEEAIRRAASTDRAERKEKLKQEWKEFLLELIVQKGFSADLFDPKLLNADENLTPEQQDRKRRLGRVSSRAFGIELSDCF